MEEQINSFHKGLNRCLPIYLYNVKMEIMQELGLRHNLSFTRRRAGEIAHTPAEKKSIEAVFTKYGVAVEDVWGFEPLAVRGIMHK